ncbi:MAG: dihydrodipicolinate reductase C-terminal domain-containing protein [Acidobacteriota bacterium]
MTRILIIGHGRMGRLVEQFAAEHQCEVAGIVDIGQSIDPSLAFDVAIDFSTAGAVLGNLAAVAAMAGPKGPALQEKGPASRAIVIGTTGWQAHDAEVRATAAQHNIGVLASANFSLGLNAFLLVVEEAARRFAPYSDYGAWIHEAHHIKKVDAPSGTALLLKSAMVKAGYTGAVDISSSRAGSIPGTHTVGFDGPADSVTLTHTVRDRAVFAHGALEAAKWLQGRRGWFAMQDVLSQS